MSDDLEPQVESQLAKADRPLTLDELSVLLDMDEASSELRTLVESAAEAGRVSRWRGGRYARAPAHEVLRPVLHRLLTAGPKTRSQLETALPLPFRMEKNELLEALRALASKEFLFTDNPSRLAHGSDRGLRFFVEDPVEGVCQALDQAVGDEPIAASDVLTPQPSGPLLEQALDRLIERGRIHTWKVGKQAMVSRLSPEDLLSGALDEALTSGPATETELKERMELVRTRKLGLGTLRKVLSHLRASQRIWRFKEGQRMVYATRKQAIQHALSDLEKRYGFTLDDLKSEQPEEPAPPDAPPGPAPEENKGDQLLRDIHKLKAESRFSTLSIYDLRKLSTLSREDIDEGLLALRSAKEIVLYEHDYPQGLEPEYQDALLRDKDGTAFNAFKIGEV